MAKKQRKDKPKPRDLGEKCEICGQHCGETAYVGHLDGIASTRANYLEWLPREILLCESCDRENHRDYR